MSLPFDTREKLQEYIDKNASQSFGLSGNLGITSFDGINFPEKILYMQFYDMPIASLTNVTFPPSIMSLTMNGNNLTTLNDVRFLPTMKTIQISNNKITSLDDVVFPPKLTDLSLHHNEITSLANVMFPPGLVSLNLSHNKITSFKGMMFPLSLISLQLAGNPIDVRTVSELKNPSPFVIREIVAAFPETGPHFQRMEEEKEEKIEQLFKMLYALNMKKEGGAKSRRKTCKKMKK